MANKLERNIVVSEINGKGIEAQAVEMVERKGIGHPDSLMDGTVEAVSRALSKYYLEKFGYILHHNTDKGQLSSGSSKPEFGGGEIISPIFVLLSGQATERTNSDVIPVYEIAIEAAKDYLHGVMPNLDVDDGVMFDSKIVPGSLDLRFLYTGKVPLANDTSFGIGYGPLSKVETLVLSVERYLNSRKYKDKHPEVGADIKVMGMRRGGRITLTVSAAFISSVIKNVKEYASFKKEVLSDIKEYAQQHVDLPVEVFLNTSDNPEKGSVYITVTGTSAEMGDAGAVGRGNRVNGLITPCRPMSLEAAAGKNPSRHIGKIYNILAFQSAEKIVKEVPTIKEIEVKLLSQIGRPIDDPLVADLKIISDQFEKDSKKAREIMDGDLANITKVTEQLVAGKASVF